MYTKVIPVTPDMATTLLAKNTSNRTMKRVWVEKYKRDMLAGNWKTTHQGILIGKDNIVVDGQHRLTAIAEAGVTVQMMVTRDPSIAGPKDLPVDQGLGRTASYVLGIDTHLAAVARLAIELTSGVCTVSPAELKPWVETLEIDFNRLVKGSRRKVSTAPVQLAAVVQLMTSDDPEWVANTYGDMVSLRFNSLDPRPLAFLKQIAVIDRTGFSARATFARAIRAFDKDKRHLAGLTIKDEAGAIDDAIELLRTISPLTL